MVIHSIHSRVHANWPMPVYPVIALLAADAARHVRPGGHLAHAARWAGPGGIILVAIVLGYFALPPGQAAPFASPADKLIGWKIMSDEIEVLRQRHHAGWIATVDYGVTGALAFYRHDPDHVQEVVDRDRYSFETPDPLLLSQPALLVVPATGSLPDWLGRCLPGATSVGEVARGAGKREIERFSVYKIEQIPPDILVQGCSRP